MISCETQWTNYQSRFKYEFLAPPVENLPDEAKGPYQAFDEENQVKQPQQFYHFLAITQTISCLFFSLLEA